MNVQPWRFVVVREPTLKAKLQVAANNQAQVGGAPAVIVLYSDMPDVIAHAHDRRVARRRRRSAARGGANGDNRRHDQTTYENPRTAHLRPLFKRHSNDVMVTRQLAGECRPASIPTGYPSPRRIVVTIGRKPAAGSGRSGISGANWTLRARTATEPMSMVAAGVTSTAGSRPSRCSSRR